MTNDMKAKLATFLYTVAEEGDVLGEWATLTVRFKAETKDGKALVEWFSLQLERDERMP